MKQEDTNLRLTESFPEIFLPDESIEVGIPLTSDFEVDASACINGAVRNILYSIGEDPDRQGLVKTPDRVARMYAELTSGYEIDPEKLINGAIFDVDYKESVLVNNIEFYSLCEHHMLPFFGNVHVAYLPKGKVIGLSKIPRIVEMFARRLQVQERMTSEIARFIEKHLEPRGVAVVVEGSHMCAMMRGVRKSGVSMVTTAMLGEYEIDPGLRSEILSLMNQNKHNH
jgi:GTP cyclohydrolase I